MATRLRGERGVYVVTLDRPRAGNAVNPEMARQLAAALDGVERDRAAVALIVTGAGDRFFCTGGDVKEYATLGSRADVEAQFGAVQRVCERLEQLPVPVIAAMDGLALGGGVELALACDLRVAGEQATLRLPQVQLGLITGWMGHWRLVRAVGEARALDLLLTARPVAAQEALALGLVHRVAPSAIEAARAMAEGFRLAAPGALRAMKAAVREAPGAAYGEALGRSNGRFLELWFSEEHREAERAFAERRPPRYRDG